MDFAITYSKIAIWRILGIISCCNNLLWMLFVHLYYYHIILAHGDNTSYEQRLRKNYQQQRIRP